ncbi:MAG: acyclic terpene utilization AtuA family protein [Gemmatimonadota bacterium]
MSRVVRIAAGQGFWGDWLEAPRRQVEGGPIDYLMLDYLAEVTMSILQKQMQRDPLAGYARDFITQMEGVLPTALERGVRVLANAGGVNPRGCADALLEMARGLAHHERLRVGVVTGDDLLPRLDELIAAGHALAHMETGAPLSTVRDRVLSANAYVGAAPIIDALGQGANVVVTGRCTDTALILAPLMHEFGWPVNDWNRLASGIVAGHIVECGAQSTGGNCAYDWSSISNLENVGFPIVEVAEDGSFVVTKHAGTGGRVDVHGVTEQLVYEMGDPKQYITPDVIADFTTIRISGDGSDRVRVFGVHGEPPTDKLKVSIAYRDGYKAVGTLVYAWPDALAKAKEADRIIRARLANLGLTFDLIYTEYVGATATHGPLATIPEQLPEVQLRIGVRGNDRKAIERFTREIAPLVLTGPPHVTGYAGGRPKVEEVIAYWPALVDNDVIRPSVSILTT